MTARKPAVAGAFYPSSKSATESELKDLFAYWKIGYESLKERKRIDCFGVVAPHAGYAYSGYVAAKVFADIPKAGTVILMGPNHYGIGPDISISDSEAWETPLGTVEVDTKFANALASSSVGELDSSAHSREHSIEVQLPFLQSVLKDFKIVPVSIKHYPPDSAFLSACRQFGKSLADEIRKGKGKALIVASTDFTHYEPQRVAEAKDKIAMAAIEKLDEGALFKAVSENDISMCGYAGVACAIAAGKALGAKKAERIAYMTSGDTTGDLSQVVGYGGLRII